MNPSINPLSDLLQAFIHPRKTIDKKIEEANNLQVNKGRLFLVSMLSLFIFGLFQAIVNTIIKTNLEPKADFFKATTQNTEALTNIFTTIGLIMAPFIIIGIAFVVVGVYYLLVKLFKGKGSYTSLFYLYSKVYYPIYALVIIIYTYVLIEFHKITHLTQYYNFPVITVINFIVVLYGLIILTFLIAKLAEINQVKAALVWLIPFLVITALSFGAFVLSYSFTGFNPAANQIKVEDFNTVYPYYAIISPKTDIDSSFIIAMYNAGNKKVILNLDEIQVNTYYEYDWMGTTKYSNKSCFLNDPNVLMGGTKEAPLDINNVEIEANSVIPFIGLLRGYQCSLNESETYTFEIIIPYVDEDGNQGMSRGKIKGSYLTQEGVYKGVMDKMIPSAAKKNTISDPKLEECDLREGEDKANCQLKRAQRYPDETYCAQIEFDNQKNECYYSYAYKNKDFSICDKMMEGVGKPTSGDYVLDKTTCQVELVAVNQDISLCDNIAGEGKDRCIERVNEELENPTTDSPYDFSSCDIYEGDEKVDCQFQLAMKNPMDACDYIESDDMKNNCYYNWAFTLKKIEICENMEIGKGITVSAFNTSLIMDKIECQIQIGLSLKNQSVCDSIETEEGKNRCNSLFTCEELTSFEEQRECKKTAYQQE